MFAKVVDASDTLAYRRYSVVFSSLGLTLPPDMHGDCYSFICYLIYSDIQIRDAYSYTCPVFQSIVNVNKNTFIEPLFKY